ncbi:Hint domain-containing protein [Aliiroseovarius subalbicans]|uniref:Hint domain-containing protein n=1 Tax=Aliiroseovarius subalbicans TaxID=2925840 RepID=UPI001F59C247|nr:Hint domain-containing protein [Aliiroseovarius subalbicans]MCI2398657.1 Hint domain-containing protein [Aliiroseovarius subalbicans]
MTGIAAGTVILTLRGEIAVEDLREGDKVITRDMGAQPLRHVTQYSASVSVIAKNSMGQNRPSRDVRVASTQPILNRGETTSVAAAMDFVSVLRGAVEESLLYRLCFDHEHIIYADGLEVTTARAA